METEERLKGLSKEISGKPELNLLKKRKLKNKDKPKMYLKVRELLSNVNSNLSEDVIEQREE